MTALNHDETDAELRELDAALVDLAVGGAVFGEAGERD